MSKDGTKKYGCFNFLIDVALCFCTFGIWGVWLIWKFIKKNS